MCRALILAFLVLITPTARAAEPPSLAVLPLQKGAASAQYDGLGRALAGMLVSDLSTLPALRLVERDQLDALLQEMKLGETGFLDPKTAQKLGKGVGARFVVAGSFTVVEPTFALDARIVAVETGEIVKAADAHGTVTDFVAVEKELVEGLIAGLDLTVSSTERRKLLMQAPTEKFTAFTAYGEGLARKEEGKVEEAKAAMTRALAEDPEFAEAQAALGDLENLIRQREAERQGAKDTARQAAYAAILKEVPEDRARPADFVYDQEALAMFALRLGILEEQRRDCDRYAEMRHYLERVGWKVGEPVRKPTDVGVLGYAIGQIAKARGLDARNEDPTIPEYLRPTLPNRVSGLFRNAPTFVFEQESIWKRGHGLLGSLLVCFPGKEALKEIDGLIASAGKAGVGSSTIDRSALNLEETLHLWWARTRASRLGADAELAKRTDALLEAHKGDEAGEKQVLDLVGGVLELAQKWEDHQVRRRGLPADEIARRMRLISEGKLADTPVCKTLSNVRSSATWWLAEYDKKVAAEDGYIPTHLDTAFATWAPPSDFGCLQGVPARFATPAAAWAWFDSAHARALPDAPSSCPASWVSYDQMLDQTRPQRGDPNAAWWLTAADQTLAGLVYARCVSE